MNLTHLINESVIKSILIWQMSLGYEFLNAMASPDCKKRELFACNVLLAQLILQDAINQLAKNDEELDQSFLSKVLLLVAITAEKMIEDDESGAVTRLKLRSQKLRGMRSFRFLEIWELQYLLGMGTGLPKEQLTMRLADVVGWLEGTTNKTLDFIVESEPEAMKNQESDQLSFGFIDHNASSIQGPKKK